MRLRSLSEAVHQGEFYDLRSPHLSHCSYGSYADRGVSVWFFSRPRTPGPTGWWCTPGPWPPPGARWFRRSRCWWWSGRSSGRRCSAGSPTPSAAAAGTRPGSRMRQKGKAGRQRTRLTGTFGTEFWGPQTKFVRNLPKRRCCRVGVVPSCQSRTRNRTLGTQTITAPNASAYCRVRTTTDFQAKVYLQKKKKILTQEREMDLPIVQCLCNPLTKSEENHGTKEVWNCCRNFGVQRWKTCGYEKKRGMDRQTKQSADDSR